MKFDENYNYAVLGVSRDTNKYGSKVFNDLSNKGYSVYGVTPHAKEINNDHIYESLHLIPKQIDILISVIPAKIFSSMMNEIISLGIKRIWFQPGSDDQKLTLQCEKLGIEVITGACIMIKNLGGKNY